MRMAQQHANIVERYSAYFVAVCGDGHEAAGYRKVPAVAGDLDDAAKHQPVFPVRGPGSVTLPISSTPTLRNPFFLRLLALSLKYFSSLSRTRASTFDSLWSIK